MRVARKTAQHRFRFRFVLRLSEDFSVDRHHRVAPEHDRAGVVFGNDLRLACGVQLYRFFGRDAGREAFVGVGDHDFKRVAGLFQQLFAPR